MENKQERIRQVMDAIREHKEKGKSKYPFTARKKSMKPLAPPPVPGKGLGKLLSPEDRQEKVKELRRRGVEPKVIANYLSVSERTIRRDMQKIREKMRKDAIESDPWEKIGDIVDFFEEVAKESMWRASVEENASHRNSFLNTALKAKSEAAKFQLETGLIHRAVDRKLVSIEIDGTPIEKMTTEELVEYKKQLLDRMSKSSKLIEGEIIKKEDVDE